MFGIFERTFFKFSYIRPVDDELHQRFEFWSFISAVFFLLIATIIARIILVDNSTLGFSPFGIFLQGVFIWIFIALFLRLFFSEAEIIYTLRISAFNYFLCVFFILALSVVTNFQFLNPSNLNDPPSSSGYISTLLGYGGWAFLLVCISTAYLILATHRLRLNKIAQNSNDDTCSDPSIAMTLKLVWISGHIREIFSSLVIVFVFLLFLLPPESDVDQLEDLGSKIACSFETGPIKFSGCPDD